MITPLARRVMLLKDSTPELETGKEKERTNLKILSPKRQILSKSPQRSNRSIMPLVRTPPPLKHQFDRSDLKGKTEASGDMLREKLKDSEDMFGDEDSFDELVAMEENVIKKQPPATSFYSASQLADMLSPRKRVDEGVVKEKRSVEKVKGSLPGARKKLSSVFDLDRSRYINYDHIDVIQFEEENAENKLIRNVDEVFRLSSSSDFEEENETEHHGVHTQSCSKNKKTLETNEMNKDVDDCLGTGKKDGRDRETKQHLAVNTQNCPICEVGVEEKDMNNHVDECLSVKAIQDISDAEQPSGTPGLQNNMNSAYDVDTDVEEATSPVLMGNRKRKRLTSSSSDDVSPSLLARQDTSQFSSKRKRVMLTGSDDDSPTKKHDAQPGLGNTLRDISNHRDDNSVMMINRKVKKRPRINQFLDLEAELSGPEGSGDEDEAEEGYEQSFVNDNNSLACGNASTAMYLRSIRSPEERPKRKLAPITDDLFSQPVQTEELVEDYEEDSFVVGSQEGAEDTRMDDTLDILERRAELPPSPTIPSRRRKRIAFRPNEDTLQQSQMQPKAPFSDVVNEEGGESMSLLAAAMDEDFVEPRVRMLQPEVDKEVKNQVSMVVNSGEVGR